MAAVNVTGKTCPKCGEFKNRGEFWKASSRKDGLKCYCKSCISGENKARRAEARSLKIAGLMTPFKTCGDCGVEKPRRDFYSYKRSPDGASWACRECTRRRSAKWAEMNRPKAREAALRHLRRKCADPAYRMRRSISSRIRRAMLDKAPGSSVFGILGYSLDELRAHVERQFLTGMSWGNYGEWHLDHIVPLSSFQFTSVEEPEFRLAWALTNLRPLWAKDNLRKHANRTHLI